MDNVRKEIINNARLEAKSILKEAEKEKKLMLETAEKSLSEKQTQFDDEAKQVLELYKSTSMAEANSKKTKLRLTLEKELLDEVFEIAAEKLSKLPKKTRDKHLALLKKKLSKEYSVIKTAQKDKTILGGLVAETKDGNSKIDLSYDNLLESVRNDNLGEITKMLFK